MRPIVCVLSIAWLVSWQMQADAKPPEPKGLSADQHKVFSDRFDSEIWPLLRQDRKGKSCVGCHTDNDGNDSSLKFLPDVASNFTMLLDNGYFNSDDPESLLARVTAANNDVRMPPEPTPPLTGKELEVLRSFTNDVFKADGSQPSRSEFEQQFPRELLTPWQGKPSPPSPPATFLTYWQLKGKARAIFADDWHRNGKDMFADNLHLLGGADFVTRYNENSKPTAGFLSAVERMAVDMASKAYLQSSGPFRDRPKKFVPPTQLKAPDDVYRGLITQLYRRILLRHPTDKEVGKAFGLLRDIYREREALTRRPCVLTFELEVHDPGAKVTTVEGFSLPLVTGGHGLYQQYLDQSADGPQAEAALKLPGTFHFKTDDERQALRIYNANTEGNVSIAGVRLTGPLPGQSNKHVCSVTDAGAEIVGAWSRAEDKELISFEDGNRAKGKSSASIPIRVDTEGHYEVEVLWRKNVNNAKSVLIEILSRNRTQLALPSEQSWPAVPGELFFLIDQTDDTVAFWDSKVSFRFASELDFVEINNAGTKSTVTVDAVKFVPADSDASFLIDNDEAMGREKWSKYTARAYNRIGPDSLTDGNQKKGELRAAYKPSIKKQWDPSKFYRVLISYAGKAGHEPHTPVIIRAAASSPVVRLRYPRSAAVGAQVLLDASSTFNIQRSPLEFHWRQVGGPQVTIDDSKQPRVRFTAPDPTEAAVQAGWEALASALLMHPDFLFTRAPSLDSVDDPQDRRRLQLGKIALDLVGRSPTDEEISRVEKGASPESLIDEYLHSREFEEFYFHRIRLLLESRGTDVQDEPVRLWCYVALGDRPFQEILTADYTVDKQMRRQTRPPHHGKSGILTTKGFIEGKPGLPRFNYAAQVAEKFFGYVFEVPPEVEKQRATMTALSTVSPTSTCYRCHKLLTPLAHQRLAWSDDGTFREKDEQGKLVDDTDRGLVASYPFAGKGMEAFATKAVKTERFIHMMIDTHFIFFFGREMRDRADERRLYKELWDTVHQDGFKIRGLIKAIVTSPEYLYGKRDHSDKLPVRPAGNTDR